MVQEQSVLLHQRKRSSQSELKSWDATFPDPRVCPPAKTWVLH